MLTDVQEYKMKIKKLVELFDNGDLPETEFIDSFVPRVSNKIKNGFSLTPREKEVVDEMFEQY